jgi:hypothetical protein
VEIYQSYRKDAADARLTFTYSGAYIYLTMPPDMPPRNDQELRTEASWSYSVYDAEDEVSGESQEVQLFYLDGWYLFFLDGQWGSAEDLPVHSWEWLCACGPGTQQPHTGAELADFTHAVDLAAIDVGEEFTVVYRLFVGAYNALHPSAKAYAWSRDPLGEGGVSFEMEGLTPTNAPFVPTPEPSAALAGFAAAAVLARRYSQRRTRRL